MIHYDQRYYGGVFLTCVCNGSVYWNVLPYASFTVLHVLILKAGPFYDLWEMGAIIGHPFVYQVFTFVLGFVIVFRANLAYQRFWEGRGMLELMSSKWSDAALQSTVFDNVSAKPEMDRRAFRARMISLFSLLHATACSSLQDNENVMEVIEGLDQSSVMNSLNSVHVRDQVFMIFTWIQDTLIRRQNMGGLAVPPPVSTRMFQEMSNGMLGFNNANKIHNTPFPFPYAQLITVALLILTATSAFIMDAYVNSAFWAALFSFLAVAGYMAINEVAIELEDPFGDDANDLPMDEYQLHFNDRLRPLLFLDEGPFHAPALEVAFAAMACTYDHAGPGPLSPNAMNGTGGYLEEMGISGSKKKARKKDDDVAEEEELLADENFPPISLKFVSMDVGSRKGIVVGPHADTELV